jgi:predicted enzyme related to lactoylglutathione lyase
VEFPADDPERAQAFWASVLGVQLDDRRGEEGEGRQTHTGGAELGIHPRGPGPGDRQSLPYFVVPDLAAALGRVPEAGGKVIHPGETFAVCRDSEGNPFGLTSASPRADIT